MLRCQANKENLRRAIATWRNIAYEDRISPSQAFFQRKQRQSWPLLSDELQLAPPDMSQKLDRNSKLPCNGDRHTKKFAPLRNGQQVWMQHPQTKEWYQQATITVVHPGGQTYTVQNDLGSTYTRGARLLRPARQKLHRKVKARFVTAHLLSSFQRRKSFSPNSTSTTKMPKAIFKTKGMPRPAHHQDGNYPTLPSVADRALDLTLTQVSGDRRASHSSIAPYPSNFNRNYNLISGNTVTTTARSALASGHPELVHLLESTTSQAGILPVGRSSQSTSKSLHLVEQHVRFQFQTGTREIYGGRTTYQADERQPDHHHPRGVPPVFNDREHDRCASGRYTIRPVNVPEATTG